MGDVPHFEVIDEDGRRVRYQEIWQRAELLLLCLADADPEVGARYRERMARVASDWPQDTRVVVTWDRVPGLPAPALVVADRWGEIQHLVGGDPSLAGFPDPAELPPWLRDVQMRCPECEGEWR